MELAVGEVYEGKVTGITKFGAFVQLPNGKSGLVHISEVANAFVSDVHEHVQIGQAVRVRLLSVSDEGKINLSIKRAQPEPEKPAPERRAPRPQVQRSNAPRSSAGTPTPQGVVYGSTGDASFEDQLKRFMQESDSRIAGNRLYSDRSRGRRRKG